ncbi:hypothetical protein KR084_007576 [Drosophila pseudotakahashii]|nr:hypothetical protein KR084_007576 [Drosophila pseudotakahashii]
MLKLASFSVLAFIILTGQGSLANSQDKGHSVPLPQDAPIQCGDFCLAKLHPMMDLIPETNSKLNRIHGEQQFIQMKLLAVQSAVEVQRITMQNSLKDITTKEEFAARLNGMEEKLMAINSEMRNQFQLLLTKMADQQTSMQSQMDAQLLALIGSTYYYIEYDIEKNWNEAAETCRGMGGHLADFNTVEELTAIMQKLKIWCWYWTGINTLSEPSRNPAIYSKWLERDPKTGGSCVLLDYGGMGDFDCRDNNYFICQLDNET